MAAAYHTKLNQDGPTSNPPLPKLEVAISGGGIAGLTAAIAFLRHPGVSVHVYERAQEFREIGASIGIGPNGLRTLEKLGAENALREGICIRQKGDWHQIYRHWQTGEIIGYDVHHTVKTKKHFTARFHRAHLHQALYENLPKGIVHLGKKTVHVEADPREGVVLYFEDGSSARADICIGADGIHSRVRKTFVPHHKLHWTGWVAMRSTFESSLVKDVDYPEDASHWIGPDRSFFHGHLGKGQFTTVGGFTANPADPEAQYKDATWDDEGSMQKLKEYYKDWHPTVQALIERTPQTRLYPNMAGDPLETWVFANRVTLVGDAAHTHGGAFAAGGSLAIDDAYALSLALHHVWPPSSTYTRKPTPKQLETMFKIYERTRKPHISKVMTLAQHQIIGKKASEERTPIDTEDQLLEFVRKRPDTAWISEHDVEAAFRAAVAEFGELGELASEPVPHVRL
ncbi:Fungal transcriptional regulatory protein, N-terminal [Pleurostoma richardsiae]|uniref:Fungal transcriptional regulatory protein, N-terminal n=1 Tax=Pleurostoma richardsiae TaxID=41990 RepID=A0AA38VKW6_9PEZI|nr:Fungal transcriptional regulatory protein, N-terminal [Pleurostoma richardsiae]